jgi:hypothetical protein
VAFFFEIFLSFVTTPFLPSWGSDSERKSRYRKLFCCTISHRYFVSLFLSSRLFWHILKPLMWIVLALPVMSLCCHIFHTSCCSSRQPLDPLLYRTRLHVDPNAHQHRKKGPRERKLTHRPSQVSLAIKHPTTVAG